LKRCLIIFKLRQEAFQMELDIKIENDSLSVTIPNPFQLDLESLMEETQNFASAKGIDLNGLDIRSLIPKMVKGIAGCEKGCPADAKGLVSRGVSGFELEYIEGGILSAVGKTPDGAVIHLKMFPDF
jgi:hypothetical protein